MENTGNVKIFTFYYQPGPVVNTPDCYVPVLCGQTEKFAATGFAGDNTGDNISEKNKYYSELTGIYWAWKNQQPDIVGTCHYRRYFTLYEGNFGLKLKRALYYLAGIGKKRHGLIYTSINGKWESRILAEPEIKNLLGSYDAIFPARRKLKYSAEKHYKRYHNLADLHLAGQIISELSPGYSGSFSSVMNQNRIYANNMFVMNWEKFNLLAGWLFPILFEFEKRVELENYTGYQQRILGFLSERLITTWVFHQRLNVKELPLIYFKKLKTK